MGVAKKHSNVLDKCHGVAYLRILLHVCSLKACGTTRDIDKGQQLHSDVAQEGLERSLPMENMLIDMYVKCNSLLEARETFNKMQVRDVISWTTIIEGYAESGQGQKALECFEQMQVDGVPPNAVTFTCTLKACANVGAIERGQEIHYMIAQTGYETDLVIGNTLIDMYAKCGMLSEACKIFEKLPVRDIIAWNAILGGYSMSHKVLLAIQCFSEMQKENVAPNAITFTCPLTSCSRAGLVLTGQNYFKMMVTEYGISPTVDHHTCMVDLFARSGRLYEAANLLESAWCRLPKETWIALLSACKIYGDSELGLRCFQNLVQRDPGHAAGYVLMSNLYAALGRWEDANSIEELRKCSGARKKPATALIEINKKVHEFTVGDNQIEEVTTLLENMTLNMKEKGYVPNLDFVLWHIPDERKESTLCGHAERLAIAYGLLHTPQGQTLRVSKNLRMCNDCHILQLKCGESLCGKVIGFIILKMAGALVEICGDNQGDRHT